jgi:transcriptional regulator GlxA family with amidase domain
MTLKNVAVVAFNKISPFHLAVPFAVLGEDRRDDGIPGIAVRVVASEKGPLLTAAGFHIGGVLGLDCLRRADTIIIPSWRDPSEAPPQRLLHALQLASRRGSRIVGLCLGTFVLAYAGLLDGRKVTTHWRYAAELGRRFPRIDVDEAALYLDDGQIVTSAGTAAGIDCCLHLMRQAYGAAAANVVARRMVVPPHRAGDQAQFIEEPLPSQRERHPLSAVLAWASERLHEEIDVDRLAARAHMTRRTFTRRFRLATGTTPARWLVHRRIALAQQLLETSDRPIAWIATKSGFASPLTLRLQFARSIKMSPHAYRSAFRATAKS